MVSTAADALHEVFEALLDFAVVVDYCWVADSVALLGG